MDILELPVLGESPKLRGHQRHRGGHSMLANSLCMGPGWMVANSSPAACQDWTEIDSAWRCWHSHGSVSAACVLLWDPPVSKVMKQIYSLPFSSVFGVVLATCLCQFTHMWTRTPAFWTELYYIFVEIMSNHSMRLEVKSCLFFINQFLKQLVLQK